MHRQEVTIYHIAKALGVSAATVSRGLKDHPAIGAKTREKIKTKAHEMGYHTNALASSLRTSRTRTLGVIVPKLDSNFMSTVLAGMEKAASESGYHLIIMQSFESKENERQNAQLLFSHRVDGLMVSTTAPSEDTEHFKPFTQKNIPVIFFDRVPLGEDFFNAVTINNQQAAFDITSHLITNGCRNIVHITGNPEISVYQHRLKGFKKALAENDIPFRPENIWTSNLTIEDGKDAVDRLIGQKPFPDALFVANDTCALSIIHNLDKKDIKVPAQIKVAGFNNDPFSEFMNPPLTTIVYPGKEMGIKSVNLLLEVLDRKREKSSNQIVNYNLKIRKSSEISKEQNLII